MGTREVTVQNVDHSIQKVVQTVDPGAARLFIEKGRNIRRYELHGMYDQDY